MDADLQDKTARALRWFFSEAPENMSVENARHEITFRFGEDVARELARIGNELTETEIDEMLSAEQEPRK